MGSLLTDNTTRTLILPQKSFKLVSLTGNEDKPKEKNLVIPSSGTEIAYLPIVFKREELCYYVKTLFGSKFYSKCLKRYLYTKKFAYQNAFVSTGKKIVVSDKNKIISEVMGNEYGLTDLAMPPTYRYTTNHGIILDFSDQFNTILPYSADILQKSPILKISEYILPELILAFAVDNSNSDLFCFLKRYSASYENVALKMMHKKLIIDFKFESTNTQLLQFLHPSKILPRYARLNPRDLYGMSLIRFIIRFYEYILHKNSSDADFDYKNDTEKNILESFFNSKSNFVFIIRNSNYFFDIDITDVAYNKKYDLDRFILYIKDRLRTEIANSIGEISKKELDNDIRKEEIDAIEEEKTIIKEKDNKKVTISKSTIIEQNNEVKRRKDAPISTYEQKQNQKLAKIVKNQLLQESINKKENISNENAIDAIKSTLDEEDFEDETGTFEDNEEEEYDDTDVLGEDRQEEPQNEDDEESYVDNLEDLEEKIDEEEENADILEENSVSEDKPLTEEEKKAILDEINKRQNPPMTPKQRRRVAEAEKKYKSIKMDNRTLEEVLNNLEATSIDIKPIKVDNVRDESMKMSRLKDMEDSYINKTLWQDIIAVFKSLSNKDKTIPMYIIDFQKTDTSDNFTNKDTLVVKLEDINQKRHIIRVDIPKIDEDGFLFINGNRKVLKKQRIPLPITKTKNDWVALSSNRNKVFMYRQGTVLNRKVVVLKKIIENYIKEEKKEKEFFIYYGDNTKINSVYLTTLEYDDISKTIHRIVLGKKSERVIFFFSQKEIRKVIKKEGLVYEFKTNKLPIGINYGTSSVIDVDLNKSNNSVVDYVLSAMNKFGLVDDLEQKIKTIKAPKRRIYSRMNLLSRQVPVITFLGAMYGIRNVLTVHQTKYQISPKRIPKDQRLFIKFKDCFLYYNEYPTQMSLLLNGLTEMDTESYTFDEFDTIIPYVDHVYRAFKSRNIIKGWTAFREFFVDHITEDILRNLKQPTDFLEIFLYANDLLGDNSFTPINSSETIRIRGYEIIPVLLYQGLAREYANFKQKTTGARATLSLPQNEVMAGLFKTMLVSNYDTINPIFEMRTKASLTSKGLGGTNLEHAYNMERRAFNPDSVGTVALATTSSGQAGINDFLTMNPRIMNTRGLIAPSTDKDRKNMSFSEKSSPGELSVPWMMKYDHPNRIGFSESQTNHIMPTLNADAPLINTGFEKILIHECGNSFAAKAKMKGVVKVIDEETNLLVVEYENGDRESHPIGSTIHRNSNFFIEMRMEPFVKVGQKVQKGDILTYSKEYFKKTNGQLVLTSGTLARVAIGEGYYTEEDGSLLSQSLSERMSSNVTKRDQISLSSRSNIIDYKILGDNVLCGDSLMIFEDQTDESDRNEVLEMLEGIDDSMISAMLHHSPKSKVTGVITDMKVYWTVPIEEMSESCAKFVKKYISFINKKIKIEEGDSKKPSSLRRLTQMSIPEKGRLNGAIIPDDGGILVEYYINHIHEQNAGDKSSIHNALKTITCQVVPKGLEPYCRSGRIDLIAGFVSITNRMINSIYPAAVTGKILVDSSKNIADEYFS